MPGVQLVETRISQYATIDIESFAEPVIGRLVSIPERGNPSLNQLVLRSGRWIEPTGGDEVIVSEPFAEAHALELGSTFTAVMNGHRRTLTVVGTALWRLTGPLSSRAEITGIYADTWSGPSVRWRLLRCEGGRLTATVHSDPSLFTRSQTLRASTASPGRRVDAAVRIPPTGEQVSLGIRTEPDGGTCTVDYVVAPTANPSEVIPGSTDDRELGVHFDAFAWGPRP